MRDEQNIRTFTGLLDRIETENKDRDRVTLRSVIQTMGDRSFAPMLLVPGLIAFSPLSGIPGIPTTVSLMVVLISGQLLMGRESFWLPGSVLKLSISQARFRRTVRALRKAAVFADRFFKPRLSFLVGGPATYGIAVFSILLTIWAPLFELLPFVISGVGVVLTFFAFGLIARDGVWVILALVVCTAILLAVAYGIAAI